MIIDRVTEMMLEQWAEVRSNEPTNREDAAHIEHLRIEHDQWSSKDYAWRLLLGARLAQQAIRDYEEDHK